MGDRLNIGRVVSLLSIEEVAHGWAELLKHLRGALSLGLDGGITEGELWERVAQQRYLVGIIGDDQVRCVFALELIELEGVRTLVVPLIGGEGFLGEWMVDAFKDWQDIAQLVNATRLRVCGRNGWERALKPLGFERVQTILERETDERERELRPEQGDERPRGMGRPGGVLAEPVRAESSPGGDAIEGEPRGIRGHDHEPGGAGLALADQSGG